MSATRRIAALATTIVIAALVVGCGSDGTSESPPVVVSSAAPHQPPRATVAAPASSPRPQRRGRAQLTFRARPLPPDIRERVTGRSFHQGCPVSLGQLRYVEMNHWGFDGKVHHGVMIVNETAVDAVHSAFRALFSRHFPIRRMHLVDDYRADDFTSIEADNTSSFNCRRATGSTRWSEHAYGRAIDINPIENPYVYANGTTTHPASNPFLDRSRNRPGMALEGRALVNAFDAVGWGWGGRWSPARDLQHFSANGR